MNNDDFFLIDAQIRKRFWISIWVTCFTVVVVCLLAVLEIHTGFTLRFGPLVEMSTRAIILLYSLIAICLITFIAFLYWRERTILLRGVVVTAEVINFGVSKQMGLPETTIQYTVNGKEFESKVMVGDKLKKSLEVGSIIEVIVDEENPKRCTVVR